MNTGKKLELLVYSVCFFISLGFTIYTTINMIVGWQIQQDVAERLGGPVIYDPFGPMLVLISLVPTLFLLGGIFKILREEKRT